MERFFERSDIRSTLTLAMFLALLVAGFVRFFALPGPDAGGEIVAAAKAALDSLFATILTTLGVAWLIFWSTPDRFSSEKVRIVYPAEISPTFDEMLNKSKRWHFVGGFGRHLRNKTIPKLLRRAKGENFRLEITAVILNPTCISACNHMMHYRNSIENVDDKVWNIKDIQKELCVTVLKFGNFFYKSNRHQFKLYISDFFETRRFDASEFAVIETVEDRKAPAFQINESHYSYNVYIQEMNYRIEQAKQLDFSLCNIDSIYMDGNVCKSYLEDLKICPIGFDDNDYLDIASRLKNDENPY